MTEVLVESRLVQHSDIRHGVRTIALILAFLAAGFAGCVENHRQINPDPTTFAWPTTIVADPAGDFVYVVSTNFDSKCTGGTIVPVSVDTLEKIPAGAVEIGSFGGEAVVTSLAGGRSRIWVPSRDSDSLEFADISRPTGFPVLFCQKGDDDDAVVETDAVGDDGSGAPVPVEDVAEPAPGFHRCGGEYSIKLKDFKATQEDGTTFFADNPYGVAAGAWLKLADGRNVQPIYVVGIVGSAMDVLLADDTGKVEHKAVAALDEGSHTIMEYRVTDSDRVVWISNRNYNEIIIAHVHISGSGDVELVVDSLAAADLLGSSGDYFRSMARSQVDPLLYATYRSPAGVAVFEILDDGGLRYRHLIPLDGKPSGVAVYLGADGTETVYVTETSLDYVYAVEPVSGTVLDAIFVGAAPYGIAIAGDRAFVANFEDSTVSVFDVDPASADYHVAVEVE